MAVESAASQFDSKSQPVCFTRQLSANLPGAPQTIIWIFFQADQSQSKNRFQENRFCSSGSPVETLFLYSA